MDPYIVFQLFAWVVWLVCAVVLTVAWWFDNPIELPVGRWMTSVFVSLVAFTIPIVNAAVVLFVLLVASGELFRWIDRKIARMRNGESKNSQQKSERGE